MSFQKYLHVKELIHHYANELAIPEIATILNKDITTEDEAIKLSKLIWQMADQMPEDSNNEKLVPGRVDNSDMLPDLEYEIKLFIDEFGFLDVWDEISDMENP